MNRRLCVWVGSIFTCAVMVGATVPGSALAQVPPSGLQPSPTAPSSPAASTGPAIPPAAQTVVNANQYAADIRAFIQYQLGVLTGSDLAAVPAARDALRKQLSRGSTPSYYAVFCREWCIDCTSILNKVPAPPLSVRLNIAIVTSTLTDNGQTMDASAVPAVEQLAILLLNDSTPSVSLWAIKAARPLVPLRMQAADVNGKSAVAPIADAIVSAVNKHKGSELGGYLAQDGYGALKVTEIGGLTAAQVKPLQPMVVDPMLDILELRVNQYKDGAILCPGAEREIATFLASQFPNVPLKTQKRMVQLMVTLEAYAGQRSNQYINDKAELSQMREMLKYVASALKVISNNDPNVEKGLLWLSSIPPAATPFDIFQHTKLVAGVMQAAFPWVTEPAAIPTMEQPEQIKPPAPAAPAGGAPAPGGQPLTPRR